MTDMKKFVHKSGIALAACLLLATTACSVQVDPSKNGKDKNVKIQTPFGGVQVKTDNMAASDIGLPSYPGANSIGRQEKNVAADVQVGFGKWQMRFKVVKYHTSDSQDQVLAYYHKALSRYGDVIQCEGDKAVGTPTTTRQGLGCNGQDGPHGPHAAINVDASSQLRAGSMKHQHLVSIDKSSSDGTDFSMVVLDLPSDEAMSGKDETRESN